MGIRQSFPRVRSWRNRDARPARLLRRQPFEIKRRQRISRCGKPVLLPYARIHFIPVDLDRTRGIDSQTYQASLDVKHHHADVRTDRDRLAHLARQRQHGCRPWLRFARLMNGIGRLKA